MAVTATPYGQATKAFGNGQFNFGVDTFKVLLTDASYTPDLDTDEFVSVVTGEITGTGYTAGGYTLSSLVWAYDAANKRSVLTAGAAVWNTATITARQAVVYKDTGVAGTSRLLSVTDFGVDRTSIATDFSVTWSAGVFWATRP